MKCYRAGAFGCVSAAPRLRPALLPEPDAEPPSIVVRACPRLDRGLARPRIGSRSLREACASDLDALCELERLCFAADRTSRDTYRRFIASPRVTVLVVEADGALAGSAVVTYQPKRSTARLYSLAVAPAHRGGTLARSLLAAVERSARSRGCFTVRLEVHEANARAIAFYRKCEYAQTGRARRYYDDGADALRLARAVPPLSRTNVTDSSRNLILDKRIRIEPVAVWFIEERKLYAVWGYRWNRFSRTWSGLQLLHGRECEMEDEPI